MRKFKQEVKFFSEASGHAFCRSLETSQSELEVIYMLSAGKWRAQVIKFASYWSILSEAQVFTVNIDFYFLYRNSKTAMTSLTLCQRSTVILRHHRILIDCPYTIEAKFIIVPLIYELVTTAPSKTCWLYDIAAFVDEIQMIKPVTRWRMVCLKIEKSRCFAYHGY